MLSGCCTLHLTHPVRLVVWQEGGGEGGAWHRTFGVLMRTRAHGGAAAAAALSVGWAKVLGPRRFLRREQLQCFCRNQSAAAHTLSFCNSKRKSIADLGLGTRVAPAPSAAETTGAPAAALLSSLGPDA